MRGRSIGVAAQFWPEDDNKEPIYAVQQLLAVKRARVAIGPKRSCSLHHFSRSSAVIGFLLTGSIELTTNSGALRYGSCSCSFSINRMTSWSDFISPLIYVAASHRRKHRRVYNGSRSYRESP